MDCSHSSALLTSGHSKRFTTLPRVHPSMHTFAHHDGGVNRASPQPAGQEQSGWGVLLRDTSTLGGIELATPPASWATCCPKPFLLYLCSESFLLQKSILTNNFLFMLFDGRSLLGSVSLRIEEIYVEEKHCINPICLCCTRGIG